MILGCKASFSYNPTNDEIKEFLAKEKKVPVKKLLNYEILDEEKKRVREALIAAEL